MFLFKVKPIKKIRVSSRAELKPHKRNKTIVLKFVELFLVVKKIHLVNIVT